MANDQRILTTDLCEPFANHFERLLNISQNDQTRPSTQQSYDKSVEVKTTPPTLKEVKAALTFLKSNKAAGGSNVPAELITLGGDDIHVAMYTLACSIWEAEVAPSDWNKAIISPFHKKGPMTVLINYRGIALLEIGYKLMTTIIKKYIQPHYDDTIGLYQAGFIRGRSTSDHIFTMRCLMEKFHQYDRDLHLIFVDFMQAYDSVNRNKLWEVLRSFGLSGKII